MRMHSLIKRDDPPSVTHLLFSSFLSTNTAVYVVPSQAERFDVIVPATPEADGSEVVPTTCACVAMFFAWIPLIGCMNFLLNLGAPKGSPRAMFGAISCLIASIVVLFWILFIPLFWYAS
jgi:hypothetical protein